VKIWARKKASLRKPGLIICHPLKSCSPILTEWTRWRVKLNRWWKKSPPNPNPQRNKQVFLRPRSPVKATRVGRLWAHLVARHKQQPKSQTLSDQSHDARRKKTYLKSWILQAVRALDPASGLTRKTIETIESARKMTRRALSLTVAGMKTQSFLWPSSEIKPI